MLAWQGLAVVRAFGTFGSQFGAELFKLVGSENLIDKETRIVHLFGYLGLEHTFAVEQGEEFGGVVAIFIHKGADLLTHILEFGLEFLDPFLAVVGNRLEFLLLHRTEVADKGLDINGFVGFGTTLPVGALGIEAGGEEEYEDKECCFFHIVWV